MVLKFKDKNDFLLMGTIDEASCFIEIESWPYAVQFGWELHKNFSEMNFVFLTPCTK